MSKSKQESLFKEEKKTTITFSKQNHFWLDSGLLGLTILLRELNGNIELKQDDTGIHLTGTEDDLQKTLEEVYDLLIERYYNLSTKKQKEDTENYNFYYDSVKDEFIAFSKRKSVGIAELIYNKAPRPQKGKVKWINFKEAKKNKKEIVYNGKTLKKVRPKLPESHIHLQQRMEQFLDERGLNVTSSSLYLDAPYAVKPSVNISVKKTKIKGNCFLCGEETHSWEDISQTTFPFITGGSGLLSFNTMGSKYPEKVCWKCSFLGKFVPVNGFYLSSGDDLFAFFPYSVSFNKMVEIYPALKSTQELSPNLYRNFNHPLGGYFQKPFEVTFAFLYNLYDYLSKYKDGKPKEVDDFLKSITELTTSNAPLEFVVVHTHSKGNTSLGKLAWNFQDSVYFFRLMKKIETKEINIVDVMRELIDFSQTKNENKTLIRNKICERILKKQSILDLVERHVFKTNNTYINPLVNFVIIYEPIIRKDGKMTEKQQATAVKLGRRIGMMVGEKERNREGGKKGDLFALRKARKKTDFLSELNRLQFRYAVTIPADIYEGDLTDNNFVEFKQFCMIAALNSYYYALKGGNQS
jgi:hypothetical protein